MKCPIYKKWLCRGWLLHWETVHLSIHQSGFASRQKHDTSFAVQKMWTLNFRITPSKSKRAIYWNAKRSSILSLYGKGTYLQIGLMNNCTCHSHDLCWRLGAAWMSDHRQNRSRLPPKSLHSTRTPSSWTKKKQNRYGLVSRLL